MPPLSISLPEPRSLAHPRRRLRFVATFVVLALSLIALPACKKNTPPPSPPLRVAIDLWAGYYPLIIASENGFFEKEGLRVEITVPEGTQRMTADFAARSYDIIGVALGDMILITRLNPEIRMFLASDESVGGDILFAKTPLVTAAQIHGKRFGTSAGGFGELLIRRYLDKNHLSPDEVRLVNIDASLTPGALARGEIDIGHTWEPYATQVRDAGDHVLFSSRETPGLVLDGLATHSQVLRQRPQDMRAFARAWFQAVDWWLAHPEAGNALVEKRLKLERGSVSLKGIKLQTLVDNRRVFAPGATVGSLEHTLHEYVEFFVTRGMLTQRVPPGDFLDPRFLP